ncbi:MULTISPECIES: hypothetical protein [unclassified Nostoc]|uniref:hypothetical protein n=1 Tax=unclassified Nostoc TaxID=2593658 RepID=UPI002AD4DA92|nr:hypothetical protein [Nostoc sp. DedQUE03]MDZ7975172.1 hypothetical protein [Nostoc sp. DedQUE03]MDZ8045851.1 hypothetical protein [Nostoc sp. DedQUE02]
MQVDLLNFVENNRFTGQKLNLRVRNLVYESETWFTSQKLDLQVKNLVYESET